MEFRTWTDSKPNRDQVIHLSSEQLQQLQQQLYYSDKAGLIGVEEEVVSCDVEEEGPVLGAVEETYDSDIPTSEPVYYVPREEIVESSSDASVEYSGQRQLQSQYLNQDEQQHLHPLQGSFLQQRDHDSNEQSDRSRSQKQRRKITFEDVYLSFPPIAQQRVPEPAAEVELDVGQLRPIAAQTTTAAIKRDDSDLENVETDHHHLSEQGFSYVVETSDRYNEEDDDREAASSGYLSSAVPVEGVLPASEIESTNCLLPDGRILSANEFLAAGRVISADSLKNLNPEQESSSAFRFLVSPDIVSTEVEDKPENESIVYQNYEEPELYQCGLCGTFFPHDWDLKRHEKIVHNKLNDLNCLQCGKAFKLLSCLQKHVQTAHHRRLKTYRCKYCEKSFGESSNLQVHIRTVHQGIKSYKCEECGKTFGQSGNLSSHIRAVHRKIKEYRCHICGIDFDGIRTLQLHTRDAHDDDDETKCPFCERKFSTFRSLQDHIEKEHVKAKTFTCPTCDIDFGYDIVLQSHLKQAHQDMDPFVKLKYKCDYCAERFTSKPFYQMHMIKAHSIGGKQTLTKDLTKHTYVPEKSYICPNCNKLFENADKLSQHILECQSYKVTRENNNLTMSKTRRAERGDKDTRCVQCGKEFVGRQELNRHYSLCPKMKRCLGCDKTFVEGESREEHLLTCNNSNIYVKSSSSVGPRFNCHKCDFACVGVTGLRQHLEFCMRCCRCGMTCDDKSSLNRHEEVCGMPSNATELLPAYLPPPPPPLSDERIQNSENIITAYVDGKLMQLTEIQLQRMIASNQIQSEILDDSDGLSGCESLASTSAVAPTDSFSGNSEFQQFSANFIPMESVVTTDAQFSKMKTPTSSVRSADHPTILPKKKKDSTKQTKQTKAQPKPIRTYEKRKPRTIDLPETEVKKSRASPPPQCIPSAVPTDVPTDVPVEPYQTNHSFADSADASLLIDPQTSHWSQNLYSIQPLLLPFNADGSITVAEGPLNILQQAAKEADLLNEGTIISITENHHLAPIPLSQNIGTSYFNSVEIPLTSGPIGSGLELLSEKTTLDAESMSNETVNSSEVTDNRSSGSDGVKDDGLIRQCVYADDTYSLNISMSQNDSDGLKALAEATILIEAERKSNSMHSEEEMLRSKICVRSDSQHARFHFSEAGSCIPSTNKNPLPLHSISAGPSSNIDDIIVDPKMNASDGKSKEGEPHILYVDKEGLKGQGDNDNISSIHDGSIPLSAGAEQNRSPAAVDSYPLSGLVEPNKTNQKDITESDGGLGSRNFKNSPSSKERLDHVLDHCPLSYTVEPLPPTYMDVEEEVTEGQNESSTLVKTQFTEEKLLETFIEERQNKLSTKIEKTELGPLSSEDGNIKLSLEVGPTTLPVENQQIILLTNENTPLSTEDRILQASGVGQSSGPLPISFEEDIFQSSAEAKPTSSEEEQFPFSAEEVPPSAEVEPPSAEDAPPSAEEVPPSVVEVASSEKEQFLPSSSAKEHFPLTAEKVNAMEVPAVEVQPSAVEVQPTAEEVPLSEKKQFLPSTEEEHPSSEKEQFPPSDEGLSPLTAGKWESSSFDEGKILLIDEERVQQSADEGIKPLITQHSVLEEGEYSSSIEESNIKSSSNQPIQLMEGVDLSEEEEFHATEEHTHPSAEGHAPSMKDHATEEHIHPSAEGHAPLMKDHATEEHIHPSAEGHAPSMKDHAKKKDIQLSAEKRAPSMKDHATEKDINLSAEEHAPSMEDQNFTPCEEHLHTCQLGSGASKQSKHTKKSNYNENHLAVAHQKTQEGGSKSSKLTELAVERQILQSVSKHRLTNNSILEDGIPVPQTEDTSLVVLDMDNSTTIKSVFDSNTSRSDSRNLVQNTGDQIVSLDWNQSGQAVQNNFILDGGTKRFKKSIEADSTRCLINVRGQRLRSSRRIGAEGTVSDRQKKSIVKSSIDVLIQSARDWQNSQKGKCNEIFEAFSVESLLHH